MNFERILCGHVPLVGLLCGVGCTTSSSDTPLENIGGAGGSTPIDAEPMRLEGAVQKGPFVIGSSITVSVLDANLEPTGQVFNTQTTNDRGEFGLNVTATGAAAVQGDGFYYNEVTGALSGSAIVLRAFHIPGSGAVQSVYVNMVTHLTAERIKQLVRGGTEIASAVAQAERELVGELAITERGFEPRVPGTSMNVAGPDTADNAYLFAVSATLLQLALDQGGSSADATLQEVLNTFSLDLADGSLEPQRKTQIVAALTHLDVARVTSNLTSRLSALGSSESAPNMGQVIDQDGDGSANASDLCPVASDSQVDTDGDGLGDACDPCPQTSCPFSCLAANPQRGGPSADLCFQPGTVNVACRPGPDANSPGECDAGLRCVGAMGDRPAAMPSEGGTGLCGPFETCCLPSGGADELCNADGSCDAGFECTYGTICGPLNGCCIGAGSLGQNCRGDGSCDGELACVSTSACRALGRSRCCQNTGAIGESCSVDNACDEGLACVSTDACSPYGCCVAAGDVGQACIEGDQGARSCNGGLACVSSAGCGDTGLSFCCQPTGGLLQACAGDGPAETRTCDEGLVCSDDAACVNSGADVCCLSPP